LFIQQITGVDVEKKQGGWVRVGLSGERKGVHLRAAKVMRRGEESA